MTQADRLPLLPGVGARHVSSTTAARILEDVSRDTITRLCESGALRAWRVGSRGHWRIEYASVIEYLDKIRHIS